MRDPDSAGGCLLCPLIVLFVGGGILVGVWFLPTWIGWDYPVLNVIAFFIGLFLARYVSFLLCNRITRLDVEQWSRGGRYFRGERFDR